MVTTNIALLDVDDAEIDVGVFAPYDREQHDRLVLDHGSSHVFRRRGDSLEAIRVDGAADPVGDQCQRRRVRRLGGMLCVLLEDAIGRALVSSGNIVCSRRRPLVLVSRSPKHDVADVLFGRRTQGRLPLHLRRAFALDFRQIGTGKGRRCAVVVDARTVTEVDGSCDDLLADGVDLHGLYVQTAIAPRGRLLDESRRTVGVVAAVKGRRIILGSDRASDQEQEFDASELYVDAGPATLTRLAERYLGRGAAEKLIAERNALASGASRWERICSFHERLASREFELVPGASARVQGWLTSERLQASRLRLPKFMVGGGRKVDATKDMFRTGPKHVPTKLTAATRICVIHESRHGERVGEFLRALRDGVGSHRGLSSSWRVADAQFSLFAAKSSSASAYADACRSALDAGGKWDLALVQVPDVSSDAFGDDNPYLVTKAKFLTRGISVQEFREETMFKPHEVLQWVLGGISLQMFAKLGGTPWLLSSEEGVHEVVLGLGSAQVGTGRFGARERIVGLTTAFSGDGAYWLTESTKAVNFEEHEAALGDAAATAISRIRDRMAWRVGDTVRIVFHSFKDFRGGHVEKIQRQLAALTAEGFKVEVAFVHIVDHHPVLLFDPPEKNRIAPRGMYVPLGDREALVSVLGPAEVRAERLGFPRPLLLKLHEGSTFTNMNYLCAQALAFASCSWRNFSPTSLPVTIQYAELIADLLGRMGDLSRWDPDVLRGEIDDARWFL